MAKKSQHNKLKNSSTKKHALDLSKTLEAIDKRDYNYYDSLTDDLKKGYSGFTLMRFMSSAPNQGRFHEYFLYAVNDIVNKDFWTISKNPDLVHLLLCICGQGTKVYHKWIPNKKSTGIKWLELFTEKYGKLTDLEIKILKKNHTSEEIYQLALNFGYTEKEADEFVKSFEKN